MANMTKEEKDQLKAQLGIGPYEKRLGKLTPCGREYRAWCPWHEKNTAGHKNPSLAIFPSKENDGEWCFRCLTTCNDKSGDVFAFVMAFDNVDFGVALRRVQNEAGINSPTARSEKEPPYEHDEAVALLWQNPDVLAYLAARGVTENIVREANLGLVARPDIGPAIAIPYGNTGAYKFRAWHPKSLQDKWRHLAGHPTDELLYGIDTITDFDNKVYVTESELDSLALRAKGLCAVSVTSATTVVNREGNLKVCQEHMDKLLSMDQGVLLLDQDKAGKQCADAFLKVLQKWQVLDVSWELDGVAEVVRVPASEWTDPKTGEVFKVAEKIVDVRPPKDIGEVYVASPDDFMTNLAVFEKEARERPPKWRQQFESVGELDSRGLQWLIEDFIPEGTIAIGALPGGYKTFFALSIARSLTTGKPFLSSFKVSKQVPVLYLIPESSSSAFRVRCIKMGIPNDDSLFLCRTLSKGRTLLLDDPLLIEAVKEMGNPVVFLDTAIRFSQAEDENAAIDNQQLVNDIVKLRQLGARAVIAIHHSKKSMVNDDMNLDNVLRGTGDLAAMCDAAYGIKRDDRIFDNGNGPSQMLVVCVKPRDFEPPKPFVVQATYRENSDGTLHSYIDKQGDFVVLAGATGLTATGAAADYEKVKQEKDNALKAALVEHPDWSNAKLSAETHISRNDLGNRAAALGYTRGDDGLWVHTGIFPRDTQQQGGLVY
ncbi:MAG: AAA family ATPase [Candidatus Acidiferrales bacterium]